MSTAYDLIDVEHAAAVVVVYMEFDASPFLRFKHFPPAAGRWVIFVRLVDPEDIAWIDGVDFQPSRIRSRPLWDKWSWEDFVYVEPISTDFVYMEFETCRVTRWIENFPPRAWNQFRRKRKRKHDNACEAGFDRGIACRQELDVDCRRER